MKRIFGYCKGQKIDTPAEDHTTEGVSYISVDHKAFNEGVTVYFTEKTGVCKLTGFHKVINPDNYGETHKNAYEIFRDRVAAKYGKYEEYDYLRDGSVWNEEQNWLDGLRAKERILSAYWMAEYGSTLPDEVQIIVVEAKELFIKVTYDFDNISEGIAAGEASQSEDF